MQNELQKKPGSLSGAILLIAGCSIGAGMLGLPVMTAQAGFKPSLLMFFIGWSFMTTTALCLLEVNLWFSDEVSIISMAKRTLGIAGQFVSWLSFVFLFYTLGIAYIAGSGELIANFVHAGLGMIIPHWIGGFIVSLLFGFFVYSGTHAVVTFNRLLMAGLLFSYILLVFLGIPHMRMEYLRHTDWSYATLALPLMIISFGFHNLIPTLTTYLQRDANKLRLSVICGSLLPLIIYIIWEAVILGLVPVASVGKDNMATELLKNAAGSLWVTDIAGYFALFAILTSFLGNSLSFVDFLADGFHLQKNRKNKFYLCLLVIIPIFIPAAIYPNIFLAALNYAGAFGAVILFGVLPGLMLLSGRYYKNLGKIRLVPGGKPVPVVIILFSICVILMQLI